MSSTALPSSRPFYGWWIAIASFFTFGVAVGLPYYNIPFFYDYFQKTFSWTRPEITLGELPVTDPLEPGTNR